MANQIKMALIETILTLHRRGWSQRRIARELGIDRETVKRYLRLESAPKPAKARTVKKLKQRQESTRLMVSGPWLVVRHRLGANPYRNYLMAHSSRFRPPAWPVCCMWAA